MSWHLNRSACYAATLFAALSLQPSRCGPQPVTSQAAEFPPAMVITEGKSSQGFPYLFGGVSSNEREAMEQRAKDYNLKLVFAEKNGPFLSGVSIVLAGAKEGEIIAATVNGPWFYIHLPPGFYEVKATFKGATKQVKNLRLTKGQTMQQTFVWDLGERAEP